MTAARPLVLAVLAASVVIALVLVLGGGDSGRTVLVRADKADHLEKGSLVKIAGQDVGKVASAEPTRDGRAQLELRIDDDDAWPLPKSTRVRFRWASTIAFTDRYVELDPSSGRSAGEEGSIPDGGTIPERQVKQTVEIDQIFNTFTEPVRKDLRGLVDEASESLDAAKVPFRRTLNRAPEALVKADEVLRDLGADPERLDALVVQTDRVVNAVRASNPDVGQLVTNLAGTLTAIRGRSADLKSLLTELPETLDQTRTTLARADGTLAAADDVVQRLSPGVQELRRTVRPLNTTLTTLRQVGPDARKTLTSVRTAVPDLNPLLDKAASVMPDLGSVGSQATEQLKCIRPFVVELAGFFSTWTGDALHGDGRDKYFHANASLYSPPATSTPLTSEQFLSAVPVGIKYAFPRPAGYNFGEPWFLPECHLGPETLDASKDPEARR